MRRTLSVLVLTTLVTGCGALHGALPYSSAAVEDSSGMTVEQYAIGRLGARTHHATACPKPAHVVKVAAVRAKRSPGACKIPR
jgi:hypothetical protein